MFAHTGTFAITAIAGLDAKLKAIVLLLVLFAAWAKSAQVPMYMWLPSAMEAPTPVSAYLHGASMVKVGVCVFARALVSAGEIPEIVVGSPLSTPWSPCSLASLCTCRKRT